MARYRAVARPPRRARETLGRASGGGRSGSGDAGRLGPRWVLGFTAEWQTRTAPALGAIKREDLRRPLGDLSPGDAAADQLRSNPVAWRPPSGSARSRAARNHGQAREAGQPRPPPSACADAAGKGVLAITLRALHPRTHDRPGTRRFARRVKGQTGVGVVKEADSAHAIMSARRGARPCAVCCCRRGDSRGA